MDVPAPLPSKVRTRQRSCSAQLQFPGVLVTHDDDMLPRAYLCDVDVFPLLKVMRQSSVWGGGPEIVALSNALCRPIHVYELASNGVRWVPFVCCAFFTTKTSVGVLWRVVILARVLCAEFCVFLRVGILARVCATLTLLVLFGWRMLPCGDTRVAMKVLCRQEGYVPPLAAARLDRSFVTTCPLPSFSGACFEVPS